MDQFTKEGRKLRPRKNAGTHPQSEKVEYTPGAHRSDSGEHRSDNYGAHRPRPYGENRGYGEQRSPYGGQQRSYGPRKPFDGTRGEERRPRP